MKGKRILVIVLASAIFLALTSGVSAQQGAHVQTQAPAAGRNAHPESVLSVATIVTEAISYQGVLEESGSPVTGDRDMTFRLYSDDTCSTQVGADIVKPGVPVDNGLFSAQLNVDQSDFNGQGLWLEVEVGGTQIGCQEILPVPYALSLRPGARIATDSTTLDAAAVIGEVSSTTPGVMSTGVRGINNGTGVGGIGVYGSQDGDGWGVMGLVQGDGKGVYGSAKGTDGYGVYGAHRATTGTNPGVYGDTVSQDANANGVVGVVFSTTPGGYSAGVRGINKGTSGTGIGVYGSQDGDGWGVYGQVDGDGRGVYGRADGAAGVGVVAQGSGPTGTAFMLINGGIRVYGAGLGTSTPVFIHQATAGNITCGFSQCTLIDHPLTNGDPNAILIVTQNFSSSVIAGATNNPHPVGVQYLSASSKWVIYNVDLAAMPKAAFNVLVVKP